MTRCVHYCLVDRVIFTRTTTLHRCLPWMMPAMSGRESLWSSRWIIKQAWKRLSPIVAWCRLLTSEYEVWRKAEPDRIIRGFMTIKSAQQPLPYIAKITLLDTIRRKMDELDASLPIALRNRLASGSWTGVPTGVCEYTR
jgi:hypothetical protein